MASTRHLNETVPFTEGVERGTGTTSFTRTRALHCNTEGTYQLTFVDYSGTPVDLYLVQGLTYPLCVSNVLQSGGTALSSGDEVILLR